MRILEPCTHDVQLAGLCALCGKDLTSSDYTGFSDTSRANIRMTHDQGDLTVSLEEARRLEEQTTTRLRQEQKLSLIVDLDQTIVHATVDPTVGEWMREDAELDAQEAHDNAHDNDEGATSHGDDNAGQQDSSSSSEGVTRQVRPTRKRRIRRNPNAEALRDVGRFKLGTSGEQVAEEDTDGCTYYIKMRCASISLTCASLSLKNAETPSVIGGTDLGSRASWPRWTSRTRCTSTRWAHGRTPRLYAS